LRKTVITRSETSSDFHSGLAKEGLIGEHFAAILRWRGGTWVRSKLVRQLAIPPSASRLSLLRKCARSGARRETANIGAGYRSATLIADPVNHGPFPINSAIADRQTVAFGKAVSAATDILNTKVWLEATPGLAGDKVCYLRLC
jgi:hypothetical protein